MDFHNGDKINQAQDVFEIKLLLERLVSQGEWLVLFAFIIALNTCSGI